MFYPVFFYCHSDVTAASRFQRTGELAKNGTQWVQFQHPLVLASPPPHFCWNKEGEGAFCLSSHVHGSFLAYRLTLIGALLKESNQSVCPTIKQTCWNNCCSPFLNRIPSTSKVFVPQLVEWKKEGREQLSWILALAQVSSLWWLLQQVQISAMLWRWATLLSQHRSAVCKLVWGCNSCDRNKYCLFCGFYMWKGYSSVVEHVVCR